MMLPAPLRAVIAARLEGVSRRDLADASAKLTAAYRAGRGSKAQVADDVSVAAYLTARLPATFAAVGAALQRLLDAAPDFAPETLLDAASGPGTASLAAAALLPDLAESVLIDHAKPFLAVAPGLLAASAPRLRVTAREDSLSTAQLPASDLVILAYALVEMRESDLSPLLDRLWAAAGQGLLLVEPGTPEGFRRLRLARERLLAAGGHIAAPCTHAHACPMAGADWCHFSVRLPRSRDHLLVKRADAPFEDEKFAYLAVLRRPATAQPAGRILTSPQESKAGIALRLCKKEGLSDRFIASRDREAFRAARRLGWGDGAEL